MHVHYISHMGSDRMVLNAARASFDKHSDSEEITEGDKSLLVFLATGLTREERNNLIRDVFLADGDQAIWDLLWSFKQKASHFAPFTHPQVSFRVTAPLAIARQLWKSHIGATGGDSGYAAWSECFDSMTEVLTDSGWKYWEDVSEQDMLAAPTVDGRYNFEKPSRLIKQPYKGDMIHLGSRDLDVCVTPNHDMFVSYELDGYGGNWSEFAKYPAFAMSSLRHPKLPRLPTIGFPEGTDEDYWKGKLHGVFLGDGSLSIDGARVYVHVKKDRKKLMLRELMEKTAYMSWNESERPDGYSYFRFYTHTHPELFTGKDFSKSINFNFCQTLAFYKGVYDGLIETDGHVTVKNCTSFSTISEDLYKDICRLGTMLGKESTNVWHNDNSIREGFSKSKNYKIIMKLGRKKTIRTIEHIPYDGYVYCATTSTGLLYVRRNDKAAVVGNCSMRYLTTDGSNTFTPDEFRAKAANVKQGSEGAVSDQNYARAIYESGVADAVWAYQDLLEQNVAPEQARFILPMATETTWVWTGSLMFWARLCGLRLDSHAQAESGEVASAISAKMSELFPFSWQALMEGKL